MSFSCIFRPKFRDISAVSNVFQKACSVNYAAPSTIIKSKVCVPLVDHHRGYRRTIDVSHLKPLNFDYGGDLKQLDPINLKDIVFKYKDIPEINGLPDHVKQVFTLECASSLERLEHRNALLLEEVTKLVGPGICAEKQICYLTVKIRNLIPYVVRERRNKRHKAYLIELIAKRRKMLRQLRAVDYDRFLWLLKYLQITYTVQNKYDYYKLGKWAQERKDAQSKAFEEKKRKLEEIKEKLENEKVSFLKEKGEVLSDIDDDIKKYDLDKEEVLKTFELHLKRRWKNTAEEREKLPRIERYRLEQKEKKIKDSRVF